MKDRCIGDEGHTVDLDSELLGENLKFVDGWAGRGVWAEECVDELREGWAAELEEGGSGNPSRCDSTKKCRNMDARARSSSTLRPVASHRPGPVGLLTPPSYVSMGVKLIRGYRSEISTSNRLGEIRGKQGPGFALSLPCLGDSPLRVALRRVGGVGRPPCRCLLRHHHQGL